MTHLTWEEMSNKEQLECIIWDAYKDAYGIRPRHMNLSAMTEQELQAELTFLEGEIERRIVEERAEQEEAIVRFEKRVQDTIEAGANDRETAIRWIVEAEEAEYADLDYLCYRLGLPYGYFKEIAL